MCIPHEYIVVGSSSLSSSVSSPFIAQHRHACSAMLIAMQGDVHGMERALKFAPNWSTEVFRVVKVTKQRSNQIARTNGDAVAGSYRREELQIVPAIMTIVGRTWRTGDVKYV